MHVIDSVLSVCRAAIVVFDNRIAYINRISCLDMVKEVGHIEAYCRDVMVWMRLLYELELEVTAFRTYLAAHSVVIHVLRKEYRRAVARTEWLELLQYTEELRCNLREVQLGIHIHNRCLHFRDDGLGYELFYPFTEYSEILFLESQAGCVKMASEILEKVGTVFYGIIKVEPVTRPSCDFVKTIVGL